MAGRPPKPMALKTGAMTKEEIENRKEAEEKFKGNDNKVYKPRKELPKEVATIYKSITNELKAAKVLNNLDVDLLETTCYAIYRMRQARDIINRDGIVIESGNGVVKHPAINIERDYQAIFQNGCIQLGLSPSSRTKLAMIHLEANTDKSTEDEVFG